MNEILESHFQCAICSDLLRKSVSLNCGHLFCKFCVDKWKKKSKTLATGKPTCPICRRHITMQAPIRSIDCFIEKTFDVFYTPESKRLREEHVDGGPSVASTSRLARSPMPQPVASPLMNISVFLRDYLIWEDIYRWTGWILPNFTRSWSWHYPICFWPCQRKSNSILANVIKLSCLNNNASPPCPYPQQEIRYLVPLVTSNLSPL